MCFAESSQLPEKKRAAGFILPANVEAVTYVFTTTDAPDNPRLVHWDDDKGVQLDTILSSDEQDVMLENVIGKVSDRLWLEAHSGQAPNA